MNTRELFPMKKCREPGCGWRFHTWEGLRLHRDTAHNQVVVAA